MVSVKQALNKGQLAINIPVFIIMFGVISLLFYLSVIKEIPFYFTPLSFVIGPFCGWIYWSFAIVKWKLWAFKNVRNRHELKEKAIRAGLIWQDDSFFNKTEIWNDHQKNEWRFINSKLKKEDLVKDDLSIPFETVIRYSKTSFWLNIISVIFLILLSCYLYYDEKEVNLKIILFLGYSIYLLISIIRKSKKEIFIKLNEKGIQTNNTVFLSWPSINTIGIKRNGFGKSTKMDLIFEYEIENELFEEKINLIYYSLNYEEIGDLIKIYRKRYKNNERTNN